MSPADDWQLAQGTVDFRNEEIRHRHRTYSDAHAQVRREVSKGSADRPALSPLSPPWPPAECPTCLTDLDENYCPCCGRTETSA